MYATDHYNTLYRPIPYTLQVKRQIFPCECSSVCQTNSVVQCLSSEANGSSATREIPRILWTPKVHHHIHNSTPPVPILSQIDSVYVLPSNLSKIYFNIILPFTPGSSKWSPSPRGFPTKTLYAPPLPTIHTTRPANLSLPDLITRIILLRSI